MQVNAQSHLYAAGQFEMGVLQPATFGNSVLGNRLSYSMGFGASLQYRFRNAVAVEIGVAQMDETLRLQDREFEETFTSNSLYYNQSSQYLMYYGAIQGIIPLGGQHFLYGQLTYQIPYFEQEELNATYDYEILKVQANHRVESRTMFGERRAAFIPELGYQTQTGKHFMWSVGLKVNFSQQNVYAGEYRLMDNNSNELLRSGSFSSHGNYLNLQVKMSYSLHKFERSRLPKPEKPEEEPEIIAQEDDDHRIDIETDNSGAPVTLNNRRIIKSTTVLVSSDTLTLSVWDNGKEIDGDSISLNLNGEWVLEDFRLERKQHTVKIEINKRQDNYLMLYALNLGSSPPNTAAIIIDDGEQTRLVKLESDMGTCGSIILRYKR